MKKLGSILIIFLILGVIGISGCSNSGSDSTTPTYNYTDTAIQTTNNNTSSSSSPSITDTNSSSDSKSSTSLSSSSATGTFVGSVNSDVYHYPSCASAKRIHSENLITFNSVTEAKNAGYRPCKTCHPPG
ncbi:MAG: hypothetical protein HZC47_10220 [Methanobacterium sp.]|uniref:Ada metal-binding domain-containing protein n=1 Tax=Methanobacterium sp. TaxID=2164 RepID=UPI003D64C925|nr:hypothetical protein [Methanobacterium sp.]